MNISLFYTNNSEEKNNIIFLFLKICKKLNEWENKVGEKIIFDEIYKDFLSQLYSLETDLYSNNQLSIQINKEVFFSIVVMIDDFFLNMCPFLREEWMSKSFEKEFFNSNRGGSILETNMKNIADKNTPYKLLIYIYISILGYGFTGGMTQEERKKIFSLLSKKLFIDNNEIFFYERPLFINTKHNIRKKQRYLLFSFFFMIFSIVLYFILWFL
jgi:type VI protein secretion system component VasF